MIVDMVEVGPRAERHGVASSDEIESGRDAWFKSTASDLRGGAADGEILKTARRHYEDATRFPDPVVEGNSDDQSRWRQWGETFAGVIPRFTGCQQVLHYAQSKIPFDHREPAENYLCSLGVIQNAICSEFLSTWPDFAKLGDNAQSIPRTIRDLDGRPVSNIFFWHLRSFMFLKRHALPARRILEIGGGYGNAARLWMSGKGDIDKYVIVDLPGSLFFSEVCLRAEFGDDVGYWEGRDPGTKVVLLPIGRLAEYRDQCDLVINIGSMQEMSDRWVDFYMQWLDKCGARYFYSLNYMGQPLEYLFESRTLWAPRPSGMWTSRVINPDPVIVKIMCSGRCFAEILYEKAPAGKGFKDWAVLSGDMMDRKSYLEGLELLRRNFLYEDGLTFLDHVIRSVNAGAMVFPKEALAVATLCARQKDSPELSNIINQVRNIPVNICV